MTTETVNILTLILGFLAVVVTIYLSRKTDTLIQSEDERAKRIIDEGNKRFEAMLKETQGISKETQRMIDEGNARVERMIEEGNARTQKIIEATQRLIAEIHQRTLDVLDRMDKRVEEKHRELIFK